MAVAIAIATEAAAEPADKYDDEYDEEDESERHRAFLPKVKTVRDGKTYGFTISWRFGCGLGLLVGFQCESPDSR
jgi:hypothetical protein